MQKNRPHAVILLYHGVTKSRSRGIENFSKKHLPLKEFDAQMKYLKNRTNVFTLRELAGMLVRYADLPPKSVAVTFDDTFKNVHDVALPVLKKYGIPATFFVSTGFINKNRRFWVDELERILNLNKNGSIRIPFSNKVKNFSFKSEKEKVSALLNIKALLKNIDPDARERVMKAIGDTSAAIDCGKEIPNYDNLSWGDLRGLDAPPDYEIGGHTVNHEILSYLSKCRLRFEIRDCVDTLEKRLGHGIDLFSYPEGQVKHFNENVIRELKRAGIKICPSAVSGVNYKGQDPFYLKRIMVGYMNEKFPFKDYSENKI